MMGKKCILGKGFQALPAAGAWAFHYGNACLEKSRVPGGTLIQEDSTAVLLFPYGTRVIRPGSRSRVPAHGRPGMWANIVWQQICVNKI